MRTNLRTAVNNVLTLPLYPMSSIIDFVFQYTHYVLEFCDVVRKNGLLTYRRKKLEFFISCPTYTWCSLTIRDPCLNSVFIYFHFISLTSGFFQYDGRPTRKFYTISNVDVIYNAVQIYISSYSSYTMGHESTTSVALVCREGGDDRVRQVAHS